LAAQGFKASQRVVANLLRELNYSCQANRKTREGANHPDRDAQPIQPRRGCHGSIQFIC
jgi:hypothetical protein